MAKVEEMYRSDNRQLGKPAIVSYFEAWLSERGSTNKALMQAEMSAADPQGLRDQGLELRKRLGDLADLKSAASRGDAKTTAGIIGDMLKYEASVQSARIRGQATVSAAQIRARETALRNSIRQNERLTEELGLTAESGRILGAMGDSLSTGRTTAPQTALDSANAAVNAVLSNEKAPAGSAKHDATVYQAYQELLAAGQTEAANTLWTARGMGPTEPAAYMAERWGMETPAETLRLQREIEKGGVGGASSARSIVQANPEYVGGGSSSRTSESRGGGGSPGSVSISGLDPEALRAFMANPSDSSYLDRLIADTERAIAANEEAQRTAARPSPFAGRYPNYLLANPFQVRRAGDTDRFASLAAMEPIARADLTQALENTRGVTGYRPEAAESNLAQRGGLPGPRAPWADIDAPGASVYGWLAGRAALTEQRVRANPDAVRAISDGEWAYEQGPSGAIKITKAPEGSKAQGTTLTRGPAYDAIVAKFGDYTHPAVEALQRDVAAMPPGLKAKMAGVAVLAGKDPAKAREEALSLAKRDPSTFSDYYAKSIDEVAEAGDGAGASALLESLATLPDDAKGRWSDAYLDSAHRGTLAEDRPKLSAAVRKVNAVPFYEPEAVRTPDEDRAVRGPADVPNDIDWTRRAQERELDRGYRAEVRAAGITDPVAQDRIVKEVVDAKLRGAIPAEEPAPAATPASVAAMGEPLRQRRTAPMDFGETFVPANDRPLVSVVDPREPGNVQAFRPATTEILPAGIAPRRPAGPPSEPSAGRALGRFLDEATDPAALDAYWRSKVELPAIRGAPAAPAVPMTRQPSATGNTEKDALRKELATLIQSGQTDPATAAKRADLTARIKALDHADVGNDVEK